MRGFLHSRLRSGGALLAALWPLSLMAVGSSVPEPAGYWMGPAKGPVATTLAGGKVIHTARLAALLKADNVMVVDVSDAPQRPEHLAPEAVWLPVPHPVIPGGEWIPGAGAGAIAPAVDALFRARLALGTHKDASHELVIYCHESCWLSWNAAKRAISYGYRHVYWYPDGMEGWRGAGLPTVTAAPQTPP